VAASRLTEVGAGDPQPLELGGRGEHPLQQLPVGRLDLGALVEGATRLGDPRREGVANPLQLAEADQPRLLRGRRHPRVDREAGERLRGKAAQLVLKAADLAPQLGARETLVASRANPGEGMSVEQLRHDPLRV
jgi:hypothetical protein